MGRRSATGGSEPRTARSTQHPKAPQGPPCPPGKGLSGVAAGGGGRSDRAGVGCVGERQSTVVGWHGAQARGTVHPPAYPHGRLLRGALLWEAVMVTHERAAPGAARAVGRCWGRSMTTRRTGGVRGVRGVHGVCPPTPCRCSENQAEGGGSSFWIPFLRQVEGRRGRGWAQQASRSLSSSSPCSSALSPWLSCPWRSAPGPAGHPGCLPEAGPGAAASAGCSRSPQPAQPL